MLDKSFCFAAIAAVATGYAVMSVAKAEEPGAYELMDLIHDDLDDMQEGFTYDLTAKSGARFRAEMANADFNLSPAGADDLMLGDKPAPMPPTLIAFVADEF